MSHKRLCLFALLLLLVVAGGPARAEQPASVWLLSIDGAIGPAVGDYISRSIEQAADAGAPFVIIQMDTPGGLDSAMRNIIKAILNAPLPVVTYVGPEGARAASAGTYILYASHIAAMAPATNLGAATPVQIGAGGPLPGQGDKPSDNGGNSNQSKLADKQVNDAIAYIQGLAERRGRNAEWAAAAVRDAASISSGEALDNNVIDLIANDINDLLEQLNGKAIAVRDKTITLDTTDTTVKSVQPDWQSELLSVIANPNMAYILLLIGIYGLIFEFTSPGLGGPGIIGAICLLLAMYAFQVLPVSYAGLGLIVLGIALMAAEAFAPSFGILGIGGLASFVFGSIILMDTEHADYRIAYPLIAGFAFTSLLLSLFVLTVAVKARNIKHACGVDTWIGAKAVAIDSFEHSGHVRIDGELWRAVCDQPIEKGDTVTITHVDGLTLTVRKGESS